MAAYFNATDKTPFKKLYPSEHLGRFGSEMLE
jgi:hypothetical protein